MSNKKPHMDEYVRELSNAFKLDVYAQISNTLEEKLSSYQETEKDRVTVLVNQTLALCIENFKRELYLNIKETIFWDIKRDVESLSRKLKRAKNRDKPKVKGKNRK